MVINSLLAKNEEDSNQSQMNEQQGQTDRSRSENDQETKQQGRNEEMK